MSFNQQCWLIACHSCNTDIFRCNCCKNHASIFCWMMSDVLVSFNSFPPTLMTLYVDDIVWKYYSVGRRELAQLKCGRNIEFRSHTDKYFTAVALLTAFYVQSNRRRWAVLGPYSPTKFRTTITMNLDSIGRRHGSICRWHGVVQ